MNKNLIVVVADYAQETRLTLEELCDICQVQAVFIHELIEFGILTPHENGSFNLAHLERVKAAVRLRRDLEVNLAGVAVVLDLLDEMEKLRQQNALFVKHFLL